MTADELATWWDQAHDTIDQVLASYLAAHPGKFASLVTALDLAAWSIFQRDCPRTVCAHCGETIPVMSDHDCPHAKDRKRGAA